ncbi:MAG: aldehyde dehydrogenase [Bacteroidales bacterium]
MDRNDPFIKNFALLGKFLRQFPEKSRRDSGALIGLNSAFYKSFSEILDREPVLNPWFTPAWIDRALTGIALMLEQRVLEDWLTAYKELPVEPAREKTIGLVLAGNIPLVGFHDILSVLAAGHRILAKPSSKDDRLIRKVADMITNMDPQTGSRICFTEGYLTEVDAVIATGSNNSSRYFEYYFREIPHIIRRNRNGVAVLTGHETEKELLALGEDIFTYFGMGCRNVTKLFVPEEYDLRVLLGVLDNYIDLVQHHKYANNVDYYRSIYLLNQMKFLDNGVLLLKEDTAIASPVGVVFYERYSEIETVLKRLAEHKDEIQCVVSQHPAIPDRVNPGGTQEPMPWDYADGVDTLRFLNQLQ